MSSTQYSQKSVEGHQLNDLVSTETAEMFNSETGVITPQSLKRWLDQLIEEKLEELRFRNLVQYRQTM